MRLAPQKTCQLIIDTENQDWGALKGNHGNLHKSVQTNFVALLSGGMNEIAQKRLFRYQRSQRLIKARNPDAMS